MAKEKSKYTLEEKQGLGKQIKEVFLKNKKLRAIEKIQFLEVKEVGLKFNPTRISEIENGKAANIYYEKLSDVFFLKRDDRIGVIFTLGYWSMPIILLASYEANIRLVNKFKFATYTNKEGEIVWNEVGKTLQPLDPQKHNYIFSGATCDFIKNNVATFGFMSSLISVSEKDLTRVCRVANTERTRHTITFIRKVRLEKEKYTEEEKKEEVMNKISSEKSVLEGEGFTFLLQKKSTGEKEYEVFFQRFNHDAELFNAQNYLALQQELKSRLDANRGSLAVVSLDLTAKWVRDIVSRYNENKNPKDKFEIVTITTREIIHFAALKKQIKYDVFSFLQELVMPNLNNNENFKVILEDLKILLKILNDTIRDINKNKQEGVSLLAKEFARFYGYTEFEDIKEVSEAVREIKFEILYYQEFIEKLMASI